MAAVSGAKSGVPVWRDAITTIVGKSAYGNSSTASREVSMPDPISSRHYQSPAKLDGKRLSADGRDSDWNGDWNRVR
jgi:hypothetical protein